MIYFLAGDNQYAIKRQADQLTASFREAHGDLAIERLDAEEVSAGLVIEATQSLPFLSPAKLVIAQNASDKELLLTLSQLEVPDGVTVIVLIQKLDRRASYYKKLSKHPGFKIFDEAKAQDLPHWVSQYAKQQQGSISLADARYLVERVGANQLLLGHEIDKLILYNPQISPATIDELTEPLPQSSVFQLLEAAFAGKLAQAQHVYEQQRAQRVEPQAILAMIAWQLHAMVLVKLAGDRSVDEVARTAKLNPFVVRKSQAVAKRRNLNQLQALVSQTLELDIDLKTKPISADQAIQNLLIEIAQT